MVYKTAPREYFKSIIEAMRKQGFDLMAWVTMNSRRNTYHVDLFRYAQESRLFFVVPNKTFIVMLELTEHFGSETYLETGTQWDEIYYQAYWSGFVGYSYDWKKELSDHYSKARDEGRFVEFYEKFEFSPEKYIRESGFRVSGGMSNNGFRVVDFEQQDACESKALLDSRSVTSLFGAMLQEIKPYLYREFRDLQVTDFAPHYTFPGQEKDFWARFPLNRLRNVASQIWGSDFS